MLTNCNISMIWICKEIWICKIFRYVKRSHALGIPKHWRLSLFRYETFINFFFTFTFSTRGERDTIFTMLTVSSDPTNARRIPLATNWTRVVQLKISTNWPNKRAAHPVDPTGLAQVRISTNCFFQKSPKFPAPRFRAWRHSHPSPFSIWGFYYDICDCHILLNVCTYMCTKPNSSKPNSSKPNDITNEKG